MPSLTMGLNYSDLKLIDTIQCCTVTSENFDVTVTYISIKSNMNLDYSFTRDFDVISYTSYSVRNGLILKSPDDCISEYNPINYLIKTIQRLS